jgi:hypothetical protein
MAVFLWENMGQYQQRPGSGTGFGTFGGGWERTADMGLLRGLGERQGGKVNGGHFSLRLPGFPVRMTKFHEKMTLLSEEAPVSGSDLRESTVSMPGNCGLLH